MGALAPGFLVRQTRTIDFETSTAKILAFHTVDNALRKSPRANAPRLASGIALSAFPGIDPANSIAPLGLRWWLVGFPGVEAAPGFTRPPLCGSKRWHYRSSSLVLQKCCRATPATPRRPIREHFQLPKIFVLDRNPADQRCITVESDTVKEFSPIPDGR